MKRSALALSLVIAGVAPTVQAVTEVKIAGWGGNDVVAMNKLVNDVLTEDFEAAGIKINYMPVESDFSQFLINGLSAGTAPDAFYIDVLMVDALVNSGKVAANTPALSAAEKAMLPNLNNAFTIDGKQYGVAKDFNTLAVQFNKDIFDDAGVDYPSNQDSWKDLLTKLKGVKAELGDEVAGICVMPDYARFAPFALSTGWQPFNENGETVLDDDFRRAFEFYTSLKAEGVGILASDIGQSWGGGCLGTEETAIAIEGNWISGYLRDKAPNMQYGTSLMPIDSETGKRGNLLFTVAWGINADGANVEATRKAVEILTSQKAQSWVLDSGLALPSRAELAESEYFEQDNQENQLAKTVFEGASSGYVMPFAFGQHGSSWMQPINEALNAVLLEQMTAEEAIKMAQAKYDAMTGK
ncbi:ABC transporter substrate-binding protein [Photobacterium sanctipauli]|uniref:ABC transporter substrate-binding protein n=1 Tax=Photobacterium sanctipauli TaxID=1342794 RepID=A0A2T3NWV5_9GAMM|nr:extracellular solute-binding protein [Photobacterium sanctipauli]PSW20745.1 ABC transporter substrate-binding protein [Photobacterium sanctipauli]